MKEPDLEAMLDSWHLELRSLKKSPNTIESYLYGPKAYIAWCHKNEERPVFTAPNMRRFTVDLLASGASDNTAYNRHTSCRLYCKYLLKEGELDENPIADMKPPAIDEKLVEPLSEDHIKAMLKACDAKTFTGCRDDAIIRFMVETISRAGETAGMLLSKTKVIDGTAVIHGKGAKDRIVPFGPFTAVSLDRYLRMRRKHRLAAETDKLWLGGKGRTFGYMGLYLTLNTRAEMAGIADFHPHQLRHTGSHRWLKHGGTEGGLMSLGGWESTVMLRRYTKALAADRMMDESRRLNLGDF